MSTTTPAPRAYDHRLRELIRSTGDIAHATRRGIPRSTARGWLTAMQSGVVTVDVVDENVITLQQEVLALTVGAGHKSWPRPRYRKRTLLAAQSLEPRRQGDVKCQ